MAFKIIDVKKLFGFFIQAHFAFLTILNFTTFYF